MGIPSFYRWVKERYPECVVETREEAAVTRGHRVSVNTIRPNPNGVEFDNLYVDLNGIIHPCFHPEGLPGPTTFDQVFNAIFRYIDRIFSIVRPRKLLFLAIDGVAPRAKMNQQRSRRFKAAKDAADNALNMERLGRAIKSGEKSSKIQLDSNVITPGTKFMNLLSSALRYYIHLRMNEKLGWRGIKVILSDASVPGEGEHKIMSYIRLQRNMPGYDPNTHHCLYGLDADLIMLALATHEIHFSILREVLKKSSLDKNASKSSVQNMKLMICGTNKKSFACYLEDYIMSLEFQFINIWILREYLAHDMKISSSTVEANLERLIDDFVFMCLFVGNDFLPHIPSLEISEGAINLLMRIYTKEFVERGGYLTNSFEVNLKHVEHFVQSIATHEHKILKRRTQIEKENMLCPRGLSNSELGEDSSKLSLVERNTEYGNQESCHECRIQPVSQVPQNIEKAGGFYSQGLSNSELANDSLKLLSVERNMESGNQVCPLECKKPSVSQDLQNMELGWKESYYAEKFEAKLPDDLERVRRHAVTKYIEGICWVMHYYYKGVCSWQWFYPYHYAPFASDFYDINQLKFHFTLGQPLKPFDQLLGVLPPARNLMTDVSSPISDFYPTDFELDMNGKRFSWQAICKLPFIEESRLLSEIAKVEHTLTDEERRRNSLGQDILFLHTSHPLAVDINSFSKQINDSPEFIEGQVEQKIDPQLSGGMNGYMYIPDKSTWPVQIRPPVRGMEMIAKNEVLFVFYTNPSFHPHIPRLLPEVNLPKKSSFMRLPISGYNRYSRRPIIKLVSGSNLAKLAHSLVSQNCLRKQPETLQSMKLDNLVNPDGLKEMNSEVKRKRKKHKKRKWSEGDDDRVGADAIIKMKTGEDNSGERNVNNNIIGKLESCIVRKQTEGRDAFAGADGSKEIKEVKPRKRKRRSKNMNNSEMRGVSNDNVDKMESCVLQEKGNADDIHADRDRLEELEIKGDDAAHGLQEIKAEVGSRKKKRRSKKKLNKNIVEKLESCTPVQQSDGGGGEIAGVVNGLGEFEVEGGGETAAINKLGELKLEGGGESAGINGLGELKVEGGGETAAINKLGELKLEGGGESAGINGLGELKVEGGLSKKKRKPKKKHKNESESAPKNIVEKLETSILKERSKTDDRNADKHKFEEIKGKEDCDPPHNVVEKLESRIRGHQSDGKGEHADGCGGESAGINRGLGELKVEVESKRKRKRHKKRKISEGDVENLQSSSTQQQNQGNDQADADGLQEMKAEVESKKDKRRSKKRKLKTTDAAPAPAPINIVD